MTPSEAAYLVALKEIVENRKNVLETTNARKDFGQMKQVMDFALINTDIYLDVSVPELLPTGVSRLSNDEVKSKFGTEIKLQDNDSGYYAAIYEDARTGKYIYANRGSGTNLRKIQDRADWVTNRAQGEGKETPQYKIAIRNAQNLYKRIGNNNITYTGHSLGGGLAAAQAIVVRGHAIVFNAAGVHPKTLARYDRNFDNVDQYVTSYNIRGEALSFVQDNAKKIAAAYVGNPSWGLVNPLRIPLARKIASIPKVRGERHYLNPVFLGDADGDYGDLNFKPMNKGQTITHTRRLHG